MKSIMKRRSRGAALAIGLLGTAVILSGCQGAAAGGGDDGGGEGVPFDASVEEWQAAFEDVDPIEIVFQSANSATSSSGVRQQKYFADRIEEYSGGVVAVEMVYGDAVAANVEADEALEDGRIDAHLLVPFLQPSDFPVSGQFALESTVTRDSSVVAGTMASYAAINETLFATPELQDEYLDRGLEVMIPLTPTINVVIACAEPLTSLDDLKGKQIRVGPQSAVAQIEALGATPVSVAFADLFESLQRGIVDCLAIGSTTMLGIPGMIDLVPYLISPVGTGFVSTPGIQLAGARWSEFPLIVKQLIWDSFSVLEMHTQEEQLTVDLPEMLAQAEAAGGGFLSFDDDVNAALKAHNDEVRASWASSTLLDGADFDKRLQAAYEKWDAIVAESGFSDAELADVDGWKDAPEDFSAFHDAFYESYTVANRPE